MKTPGRIVSIVSFWIFVIVIALFLRPTLSARATENAARDTQATDGSWYFTVSGDSRDCGDVIMPKIAHSIESNLKTWPVQFYWHLGDFRALYRIDCDIAKRTDPNFNCDPVTRINEGLTQNLTPAQLQTYKGYLGFAWDDFIASQVKSFHQVPVYLGVGNHEFFSRTGVKPTEEQARADYLAKFGTWQPPRFPGASNQPSGSAGEQKTYYHFVVHGVDFIYLDNAGVLSNFDDAQLDWLAGVLAADKTDPQIKTIIVGMHAALPQSISRGHAMDHTCAGIKSGLRAYNMIFDAQNLSAPPQNQKKAYVFSSHSHYFEERIYDTPEHKGRVLPGWIIGTSGAEQYVQKIMYGYLRVKVKPGGDIDTQYVEINQNDASNSKEQIRPELINFCFSQNKKQPLYDALSECDCKGQN